MKILSVVLSIMGFVSGMIAAHYWHAASRVAVSPAWELDIRGDVCKNIMGWVAGNMIAFKKSGELNRRAALWTAVAVVLSMVGGVLLTLA